MYQLLIFKPLLLEDLYLWILFGGQYRHVHDFCRVEHPVGVDRNLVEMGDHRPKLLLNTFFLTKQTKIDFEKLDPAPETFKKAPAPKIKIKAPALP